MEISTRLLDTAACEGQVLFHPLCAKISLTHLCFADDLMVFTEASEQSLLGVKQSLD